LWYLLIYCNFVNKNVVCGNSLKVTLGAFQIIRDTFWHFSAPPPQWSFSVILTQELIWSRFLTFWAQIWHVISKEAKRKISDKLLTNPILGPRIPWKTLVFYWKGHFLTNLAKILKKKLFASSKLRKYWKTTLPKLGPRIPWETLVFYWKSHFLTNLDKIFKKKIVCIQEVKKVTKTTLPELGPSIPWETLVFNWKGHFLTNLAKILIERLFPCKK
jgi:hypothetical protein